MKLEKILENVNSLEKNAFIKVIDCIISNNPKNSKEIEKIRCTTDKELKNIDNIIISKIFNLVQEEFTQNLTIELTNTCSQFNILSDILGRDGKNIMRLDWFSRLYEAELKILESKTKALKKDLEDDTSEISEERKRDYNIYKSCVETAYNNDKNNNQDPKITGEELLILVTLGKKLDLSQEEIKLLNYLIIPAKKNEDLNQLLNYLKNLGVIFYSKKTNMLFIADEVVMVLRKIRGKEVADKFFRRILNLLKEPQINLIVKKHNIDKKLTLDQKIKEIMTLGTSLSNTLINDIHKAGTKLTAKKIFLNQLCDKGLQINPPLKGTTLEEKVKNLIQYFEALEKDDNVSISLNGYEKLLIDLEELPKLNNLLKSEFQLQDENVLNSEYLLNYNIKPRDILDLIPTEDLKTFAEKKSIKTKGDIINNILLTYKDSQNIDLENYENIALRNLNTLKTNGIKIKESELGLKFEELTKIIFTKLKFNVDEKLKKIINTNKDKIDIVINLGNNELILIECKTIKDTEYNKFSTVSRQMKSYLNLAKKKNYKVIKSLLIAPSFSDKFINECELEYDLNLSLITANSLIKIFEGFEKLNHEKFPYNLLMRDVLIKEDRILKALEK